jgi:hypothetical protein
MTVLQKELKISGEVIDRQQRQIKLLQQHQRKRKENRGVQTSSQDHHQEAKAGLTPRKVDLMVQIERQRLQLRKAQKKAHWQKQKISKMLFFFFTLQNKGVPVNDLYESEGIKAIRTDRFDEIMGQIASENGEPH